MTATQTMAKSVRPQESFFSHPAMAVNEYVRKDVFAARMDRMEALLAQTLAEIRLDNVKLRSELKDEMKSLRTELKDDIKSLRSGLKDEMKSLHTELKDDMKSLRTELKDDIKGVRSELKEDISELRGDIRVINARLDTQQTKFGWYLAIFGLIITVVVTAIQWWK